MATLRKAYPSDVSDEEWEFCAPYLTLMKEQSPQRQYPLREIFNALRWFIRAGCPWRMMPNDLPPWTVIQQQTLVARGLFEAMAHDLRVVLRQADERDGSPARPFWTAARSNPHRRAVRAPASMGTRSARVPKCMRRWTRWATCWPSK